MVTLREPKGNEPCSLDDRSLCHLQASELANALCQALAIMRRERIIIRTSVIQSPMSYRTKESERQGDFVFLKIQLK